MKLKQAAPPRPTSCCKQFELSQRTTQRDVPSSATGIVGESIEEGKREGSGQDGLRRLIGDKNHGTIIANGGMALDCPVAGFLSHGRRYEAHFRKLLILLQGDFELMPSMLLKEKLECRHCLKPFQPKRVNQVYCSPLCASRIRLPDIVNDTRDCPCCKNTFVRQRTDQVYCSENCRRIYNLEHTETLHIPKSVFVGTREEIVSNLERWLETKGYLEDED